MSQNKASFSVNTELPEGFAVRQGHLAPPNLTPDSPRPKNAPESNSVASLLIPAERTKDGKKK